MRRKGLLALALLAGLSSCGTQKRGVHFAREHLTFQRVTDHGGTGEIPLHWDKQKTGMFVPATIGKRKGWLQVDTGAPVSLLSADVCDDNGFVEHSRGDVSSPAGGTISVSAGSIFSIQLGDVEIFAPVVLRQENASYFNSIAKPTGRGAAMGLLGLETLRLLDAEIDLREQVIRLGPRAGYPSNR